MHRKSNHNYTIWDGKIGLRAGLFALIPRSCKWLKRKSLPNLL
jgi:hypothetical protein